MGLLSKSAVEKARDRVSELEATVARWESEAAARRAEREGLEARAGDEVLADETAVARLSGDLTRLAAEESVAAKAAAAAARQLDTARRDVLRTQAAELRDRAGKLVQVADERQRKTDRLLAELKVWEGGTDYVPFERNQMTEYRGDVPADRTPTTVNLRFAAIDLERQAAELEQLAQSGDTGSVLARLSWPASKYEPQDVEREFAGAR